jgi:hypothetical protein
MYGILSFHWLAEMIFNEEKKLASPVDRLGGLTAGGTDLGRSGISTPSP